MRITEKKLRRIIRAVIRENYNHNLNENVFKKVKDWWKELRRTDKWKDSLDYGQVQNIANIIEDYLGFDNPKIAQGNALEGTGLMFQKCALAICEHYNIDPYSDAFPNSYSSMKKMFERRVSALSHTYGIEKSRRGGEVRHSDPIEYLDDHRGDGSAVKEAAEHIAYAIQRFRPEAFEN